MQVSCHPFKEFANCIRQEDTVSLCRDGKWKKHGLFSRFFNTIFFQEKHHLIELMNTFSDILGDLEHAPAEFPSSKDTYFSDLLEAGNALVEQFEEKYGKDLHLTLQKLKRRLIALAYRTETIKELNANSSDNQLEKLKNSAEKWKRTQHNLPSTFLSERDHGLLIQSTFYATFLALIEQDPDLKDKFFIWIIQDHNDPAAFIEYPSICEELSKCNLQQRIGRIPGVGLQILYEIYQGKVQKILTLPFDGRHLSILDPNLEIELKGSYRLKLAEIFSQFSHKEIDVGNVEYLATGITNWNIHYLGYWDANMQKYQSIDMKNDNWWNELPEFEILTIKEVEKRYGAPIQGKPWIVSAAATRQSFNLDLENTHAYLHVAIPQENDTYRILNFGKFGFKYPKCMLEKMLTVCVTQTATIAYPDENVFYSNRQTVFHPFVMTEYQALKVLQSIRQDIIQSRSGNLVYQIHADNCAMWTNEKLAAQLGEDGVPDMYSMPMWNTEPKGFLGLLFKFIRKLPDPLQVKMLTICHFPFNSWKGVWVEEENGKIWKSLTSAPFWKNGLVYLPALLHYKKELGILSNVHHCSLLNRVGWKILHKDPLNFLHYANELDAYATAILKKWKTSFLSVKYFPLLLMNELKQSYKIDCTNNEKQSLEVRGVLTS